MGATTLGIRAQQQFLWLDFSHDLKGGNLI